MSNYPYAPPPPAPSAAPPSSYHPYQSQAYGHGSSRGGPSSASSGGRARSHHQSGPGRSEYGAPPYYQQQEYAASPASAPYTPPQHQPYWQSPHTGMSHHQQTASPLPATSYQPAYPPQGYVSSPAQGYQPQYPSQPYRSYSSAYQPQPHEYHPPQQYPEQGHSYSPYTSRGSRGGHSSDRGGHKTDSPMGPPMRMGFDQRSDPSAHGGSSYAQPYSPSPHQPPAPYPPHQYGYSASQPPPYSGSHTSHGSNNRGGQSYGRDGFLHSNRGGRTSQPDRGGKFHHRDQRPQHGHNNNQNNKSNGNANHNSQKSDHASSKKKKRKTNTLGLTPGDEDSDDAAPPSIDKDEAEADRLRKRLAKVERKLEKRKRAANDEGDEMRGSVSGSSDESDDEKPEVQSSSKPANTFLPPPPVSRADPSNHCKYYSTGGTCGKKGKCRFKHDPAVREAALQERTRNGGRMTLKQRLQLNDKDHEDMEVVKAIVEMRSNGRIPDPDNPQHRAHRHGNEQTAAPKAISTLPSTTGAANLPPNPYSSSKKTDALKPEVHRPYETWYLGGFSNPNKDLQPRQLP
ncbi:hypothetical protein GGR56DRAFT_35941 [Xylariaceae sp. FL0804]|nr:hypothetical protein GGR56DRAFT_35941 [Xylariaceae sp. FL0804]